MPMGGEIFRIRSDQPWGQPSAYTICTVYLPGVKRPGCGVDRPPQSNAEVQESTALHLLPFWAVVASSGVTFTFTLPFIIIIIIVIGHDSIKFVYIKDRKQPSEL